LPGMGIGFDTCVDGIHDTENGFSFCCAVLCPLYYYHEKHPVNLILLGFFTVAISFAVGMTCAFTSGNLLSVIVLFLLLSAPTIAL